MWPNHAFGGFYCIYYSVYVLIKVYDSVNMTLTLNYRTNALFSHVVFNKVLFRVKLINQRLTVRSIWNAKCMNQKQFMSFMKMEQVYRIDPLLKYNSIYLLFIKVPLIWQLIIIVLLGTLSRRTWEWLDVFRILRVMLFELKYECFVFGPLSSLSHWFFQYGDPPEF